MENLLLGQSLMVPARGYRRCGPFLSAVLKTLGPIGLILSASALSSCSDSSQNSLSATGDCDRDCVIALTDRYVEALLRKDSAGAGLAGNFRLVENLQLADRDRSQWQYSFEGPPSFAVHVPDPQYQQAGWMGVVGHDGKPVLLAIRLQFHDGRIIEAEHLFTDLIDGSQAGLAAIHANMGAQIPEKDRLDRRELIRIAASYYNALDGNDGSLSPFAADCRRVENGVIAAGEGALATVGSNTFRPGVASDCRSQIDSQAFVYIDRIENRRMVAADPQTGLVMGFSRFRHSMENLPYKVTLSDGSTFQVDRQNMPHEPFDLAAAHIFKIGPDGMITSIEAVGLTAPYGTPTEWE